MEERDWLDEHSYLGALSFCRLLPGPEAMPLATYAGWRLRGVPGDLIAGGLFVLPDAAVILALSPGYAWFGDASMVAALFTGIKAAVVVIVIQAMARLVKKALNGAVAIVIAATAIVGLFALTCPFR